MANDESQAAGADLIDVGDISTDFEDDFTREKGAGPARPAAAPPEAEGLAIAELKDRFAALAIDLSILYLFFWLLLIPFRAIALGQAAGPVPASGTMGLFFHGIVLLLAFLWFTLFEFAVHATPGKMLCHLSVRRADGSPATFLAAIVRNLLRPVDILLTPILLPIAVMEWSAWHRRLGDIAAGTVVIRHLGRMQRQYALSLDIVASASLRAIAFLLDLVIVVAFSFGFGLLLSPEQPLVSMVLVVFFPLALLCLLVLPEWLAGTSPGKWILGLAICHEDGSAIGVATAFVRNLWRICDCNPFGFLTALFSVRRQRPGDTAAGSIVVRVPREWRGAIALAVVLLVSASIVYAGLQNRASFLSGDFQVNFLPSIDWSGTGRDLSAVRDQNLSMRDFAFAGNTADAIRKPAIFKPGEALFMVFDVGGFGVKVGKAWIQEDLSIRYPDGSVGLKLENINDFNQELPERGLIRFENTITLPPNAQPGRYTVTITLRDKLSRREVKEQRFFYITPPEGEAATPPAAPPPTAIPEPRPQPQPAPSGPGTSELGAPPSEPAPPQGLAPAESGTSIVNTAP